MKILDISNPEELNKEFCKLVGIRPIKGALINDDTGEVRTYISSNSVYKTPKGWTNFKSVIFKEPMYPNFLELENFYALLELQWQIFGSLGGSYNKIDNENFITNYLYNKVKAIQILKSYGGSEMLDIFIKEIQKLNYSFNVEVDYDIIELDK